MTVYTDDPALPTGSATIGDITAIPQITAENLADAQSLAKATSVTIAAALDLSNYRGLLLVADAAFHASSDGDLVIYIYPIKPGKAAYSLAAYDKTILVNNAGGVTDAVKLIDVSKLGICNIVATNENTAGGEATTFTVGINKGY